MTETERKIRAAFDRLALEAKMILAGPPLAKLNEAIEAECQIVIALHREEKKDETIWEAFDRYQREKSES